MRKSISCWGQGQDETEALAVIGRFQNEAEVAAAWNATHELWDDVLGAIQVQTPDPAMNVLLNRWLLYQTLACRVWGRSAFYQASGAFGFRDQLQDVMALVHVAPHLAREHILESAPSRDSSRLGTCYIGGIHLGAWRAHALLR